MNHTMIKLALSHETWSEEQGLWLTKTSLVDVPAEGWDAHLAEHNAEFVASCDADERAELEAFLALLNPV